MGSVEKKNCSFVGYTLHSKGYCVHDHDNWIIMECQDVFFFEGLTVNSRYKQRQVELHEISKDKGILTSESSDIGNVGNESLG